MKRKTLFFGTALVLGAVLLGLVVYFSATHLVLNSPLKELFLTSSGVTADQEYLSYTDYQRAGELDESGAYIADYAEFLQEETENSGSIHVSFAENAYLRISYYSDKGKENCIDTEDCYLNIGDSIYAGEAVSLNGYSNLYQLVAFRIYSFDQDGNMSLLDTQELTEDSLVFTIPSDFDGTELSIVPIGEYPDRRLDMTVFYTDQDGNTILLANAGSWYVNDTAISGNSAEIGATESYTLRFVFDSSSYFYVSASPSPFTTDPNNIGYVEFWQAASTDSQNSYTVELHPYLSLELKLSAQGTISLNGESSETVKKGKSWSSSSLKYGDVIVIETSGECSIESGDYTHVEASCDPISGGYRYTLTITDNTYDVDASQLTELISVNRSISLTLPESGKYGTCTYRLDKETVSGSITLTESQRLTLTYTITEEGYCFKNNASGPRWVLNAIFNKTEISVDLSFDPSLNGQTLNPDDYVEIIEKD